MDHTLSKEDYENHLRYLGINGILNDIGGAYDRYLCMRKKEKEDFVLTRIKSPIKLIKKGDKNFYRCVLYEGKKQKQITAATYDKLIDKLYGYFTDGGQTVEGLFNKALREKAETTDISSNTIDKSRRDFNRFISPKLRKMNITSFKIDYLKRYTKELCTNTPGMKLSSFKAYKGVLNLIYEYAISEGILEYNPAVHINPRNYYKLLDTTKKGTDDKTFSLEEIRKIQSEIKKRESQKRYHGFYHDGYAFRLSILTGMRAGEICALKWSDVDFQNLTIHIHEQQLIDESRFGNERYYEVGYTKDEKGFSQGGRYFPIYENCFYGNLKELLLEIHNKQQEMGIQTAYVCCRIDGSPIKKDNYMHNLQTLCESLDLAVTNNHAFRMTLDSLVLINLDFKETERAKLLGHSVETNLKHYSFDPKDSNDLYLKKFNLLTGTHTKIIPITAIKKAPKCL